MAWNARVRHETGSGRNGIEEITVRTRLADIEFHGVGRPIALLKQNAASEL
jgi:hypothetical protein